MELLFAILLIALLYAIREGFREDEPHIYFHRKLDEIVSKHIIGFTEIVAMARVLGKLSDQGVFWIDVLDAYLEKNPHHQATIGWDERKE